MNEVLLGVRTVGADRQASLAEPQSIRWANNFAQDAPNIRVPIPGPKSLALMSRRDRHTLGDFSWVTRQPIGFAGGNGVTIDDVDGNRLIDLTHGHMAAGLGHGNPEICDAIDRQTRRLMNLRNFPTEVQVELTERLAEITPGDLNIFGFYSSGTEAMEGAMRVARAVTGGHEFLSFYGDYHGKTSGAVATSEVGNRSTGPRLSGFTTVPGGYCRRCEFKLEPSTCGLHCLEFAERAMKVNSHGALAGIIAEPVTNGSGARVYPSGYLRGLREIADRNKVMLIFDEHASGLGRTGTWWAGDREGVIPDIMFFGKTLGNGYPITCVAVSEKYRERVAWTSHSSTHGGQPVGCAAALMTLDIIMRDGLVEHIASSGPALLQTMKEIEARHSIVGAAQGLGYLLGFEFVDPATGMVSSSIAAQVSDACFRNGVCTSTAGSALRVSPMFVTSRSVALRAIDLIEQAIAEVESRLP
jgi:4-aminobutyrate aminotransferase-like enzyme